MFAELVSVAQSFIVYGVAVTVVVKFLGEHPRVNAMLFGACVASTVYLLSGF